MTPFLSTLKAQARFAMKSRLQILRPWESSHVLERLTANLDLVLSGKIAREGAGSSSPVWGGYRPLTSEPDPWRVGKVAPVDWVFPRFAEGLMTYHRTEVFVRGSLGIGEPGAHEPQSPTEGLTGVLVPGLAFDRHGRRLGRGIGCFDRFLKGRSFLKVGVAFECQMLSEVPVDPRDENVDIVVTEAAVYECRGAN